MNGSHKLVRSQLGFGFTYLEMVSTLLINISCLLCYSEDHLDFFEEIEDLKYKVRIKEVSSFDRNGILSYSIGVSHP